jgi:hypothetical protein
MPSAMAAARIQRAWTTDITMAKINPGVPKMAATPAVSKRAATTRAEMANNGGRTDARLRTKSDSGEQQGGRSKRKDAREYAIAERECGGD